MTLEDMRVYLGQCARQYPPTGDYTTAFDAELSHRLLHCVLCTREAAWLYVALYPVRGPLVVAAGCCLRCGTDTGRVQAVLAARYDPGRVFQIGGKGA
jgi:hypothetical protein